MKLAIILLVILAVVLVIALVVTSKKYKREFGNVAFWRQECKKRDAELIMLPVEVKNRTLKEVAKTLKDAKLKGFQVAGMKECVKIVEGMKE